MDNIDECIEQYIYFSIEKNIYSIILIICKFDIVIEMNCIPKDFLLSYDAINQ